MILTPGAPAERFRGTRALYGPKATERITVNNVAPLEVTAINLLLVPEFNRLREKIQALRAAYGEVLPDAVEADLTIDIAKVILTYNATVDRIQGVGGAAAKRKAAEYEQALECLEEGGADLPGKNLIVAAVLRNAREIIHKNMQQRLSVDLEISAPVSQ